MATSPQDFAVRMYEEHLEDASFLYEQQKALRQDPELAWTRLADFEERLEAHLDALMVGGPLALKVCERRAAEGDAGELFAAVSVYCRHADARLLAETWRALDYDDAAKTRAVTDALKYELPDAWYPHIQRAIERGDPRQVPLLARVCRYRRAPCGFQLLRRVATDGTVTADILRALSQVADRRAAEALLLKHRNDPDPAIRTEAYLGLARCGRRDTVRECLALAAQDDWPQMVVALAGDRAAAAVLRKRLEGGKATPTTLLALGLLGDLTTVRTLSTVLESEELGEPAAWALHWITGAPLFERAFVAEPVDEAALFDDELRVWRERREPPRRADGQPFGLTVRAPVCDPEVWATWLADNAAHFNPDYRYRRGQHYSARALVLCLLDESVPNSLRQLAYEELNIRFGCDVPFESDLRVNSQRAALQDIAAWLTGREMQLDRGRW